MIVPVQVAFVGHDAGHNAVAHNSKYDGYIGLLVNACIGIGPSWWKVSYLPTAFPALLCPALPCPALPCPALPCTCQHCPALHLQALPCPCQHCTALHFPALPCFALHCLALHCPGITQPSTAPHCRLASKHRAGCWPAFALRVWSHRIACVCTPESCLLATWGRVGYSILATRDGGLNVSSPVDLFLSRSCISVMQEDLPATSALLTHMKNGACIISPCIGAAVHVINSNTVLTPTFPV